MEARKHHRRSSCGETNRGGYCRAGKQFGDRNRSFAAIGLAVAVCLISQTLAGQPSSQPDVPLREACRKEFAHKFIQLYEQHLASDRYTEALSESLGGLNREKNTVSQTVRDSAKLVATHTYDPELAEIHANHLARIRFIDATIQDQAELLKQAKTANQRDSETFTSFAKKISEVFLISYTETGWSKGYPNQLEYRAKCPLHYTTCALPRQDAETLREIAPLIAASTSTSDSASESCLRFSQIERYDF